MQNKALDEKDIFERIATILRNMLIASRGEDDIKTIPIALQSDIYTDLGIDSVEVLDLLCLVETEFKITVDTEKASKKRRVSDLIELVSTQLKG